MSPPDGLNPKQDRIIHKKTHFLDRFPFFKKHPLMGLFSLSFSLFLSGYIPSYTYHNIISQKRPEIVQEQRLEKKLNEFKIDNYSYDFQNENCTSTDVECLIELYSVKYNIDENIAKAIMEQESGGKWYVVSKSGAAGAMQLMPGTARDLGLKVPYYPLYEGDRFYKCKDSYLTCDLENDERFNIEKNIEAGIKLIKEISQMPEIRNKKGFWKVYEIAEKYHGGTDRNNHGYKTKLYASNVANIWINLNQQKYGH